MSEIKFDVTLSVNELVHAANEIKDVLESSTQLKDDQVLVLKVKVEELLEKAESIVISASSGNHVINTTTDTLEQLEGSASKLWNSASITTGFIKEKEKLFLLNQIKFFSVLLFKIHESLYFLVPKSLRTIGCLIRLFSSCLDYEFMDLSKRVRDYSEALITELLEMEKVSQFDVSLHHELYEYRANLTLLELVFSLNAKDYEGVKLYESKFKSIEVSSHTNVWFLMECSRCLFNSGLVMFEENDCKRALYFIQKSIDLLEINGVDYNNILLDHQNRRFQAYVLLVQCLQKLGSEETLSKIETAIQFLQKNYGDRLEIYYLSFQRKMDDKTTEELMMRMVKSVSIIDSLDKILKILRNLCPTNFPGVQKCLDYIFTKLDASSNHNSLEIVFITRFYSTTLLELESSSQSRLNDLSKFMKMAENKFTRPISYKVRASVITLLWKQGAKSLKTTNFEEAIGWFNLCLDNLLNSELEDNSNIGKILRSIQNCYIYLNSFDEAIAVVKRMNYVDKEHSLTQYNLFKCYTELKNEEGALKCIEILSKKNDAQFITILATCVIESINKVSLKVSIQLMMQLVSSFIEIEEISKEFLNSFQFQGSKIPVALRCTIVTVLAEIEKTNDETKFSEYINVVLEMFSLSVTVMKKLSKYENVAKNKIRLFSSGDIEWFSSKAYNTACICIKFQRLEDCVSLSNISIEFNDLVLCDLKASKYDYMKLWKTKANIILILVISLRDEISFSKWNKVKIETQKIRDTIEDHINFHCSENSKCKWLKCYSQVLIFQFQSEIKLNSLDNLKQIIIDSQKLSFDLLSEIFNTFVNLLLNNKEAIPIETRNYLIFIMIDISLNLDSGCLNKDILIWLRTLFETIGYNKNACDKLISQLYDKMRANNISKFFSSVEVEWLASCCWNHGVSLIINRETDEGTRWCTRGVLFGDFVPKRLNIQFQNIWSELAKEHNLPIDSLEKLVNKFNCRNPLPACRKI